MTQEQLEKARPYLADEDMKAQYPDVDFDPQGANPPRLDYVTDVVKLHGRDQAFLLALIFSGSESIDCCKILRRVIKDFRHYILACYRAGVPFEEVEIVNVDELRRIVYKVLEEANTMDMCIKLLNDNEALAAEVAALREEVEVLKQAPAAQAMTMTKSRGSASNKAKASESSENSESSEEDPEATPVTEEDMEEFYSEKAREAVKACEKELMGTLSIIIPDKGHRRRFIRSIPSPNSMDELLNQLFRPACEREIMDVDAAKGLKWSDYIYDLTDFTTPIQVKQFDSRLRDFFNEMIAKRKKK